MYEMTQIIAQTILVRDLQKVIDFKILSGENTNDVDFINNLFLQESILDLMLSEYIKAYDGLLIIETITEKPLNHTHHEKPY